MSRSNPSKENVLNAIEETKKEIKKCESLNWKYAKEGWKVYLNLLEDRIKNKDYE